LVSLATEKYRDLITSSHRTKIFFLISEKLLTLQVLVKLPCT